MFADVWDWVPRVAWFVILLVIWVVRWLAARLKKMRELRSEEPSWTPSEESLVHRFRRAHEAVLEEARAGWAEPYVGYESDVEAIRADRERLKVLAREAAGSEEYARRTRFALKNRESLGVMFCVFAAIVVFIVLVMVYYEQVHWRIVPRFIHSGYKAGAIAMVVAGLLAVVLAVPLAYKVGAWRGVNPCEYGWRLLERGAYRSAVRYLRRALDARPASFDARYGLATALAGENQWDEAYECASGWQTHHAASPLLHELLSIIESNRDRMVSAAEEARRAAAEADRVGARRYAEMMKRWAAVLAGERITDPVLWVDDWQSGILAPKT